MNDNGPIEQIKELTAQANMEIDLAVASHNAAMFRRKIEELSNCVAVLEANLKHQTNLIEQLFALLEIKEQKDDGRYFHPNIIRSSRALDAERLEKILAELKRSITANDKSDGKCGD